MNFNGRFRGDSQWIITEIYNMFLTVCCVTVDIIQFVLYVYSTVQVSVYICSICWLVSYFCMASQGTFPPRVWNKPNNRLTSNYCISGTVLKRLSQITAYLGQS